MQKIRISSKLTLVFGLTWRQHDRWEQKLSRQISLWREEGYRFSADYEHHGGRVYGMFMPSDAKARSEFDDSCISGAALIATHPKFQNQTAIVLIEYPSLDRQGGSEVDGEDANQDFEASESMVIFVGLRDGVVVMDHVVNKSEILELRNAFRRDHCTSPPIEFETYGEVSGDQRVDHAFLRGELTPSKSGGKACYIKELRSSKAGLLIAGLAVLALAVGGGYIAWQMHQEALVAEMKRKAMQENTPQVMYAREIERWSAREINLVGPSVEFLRKELLGFDTIRAGWVLVEVSCLGPQCSSRWRRESGTLKEFRDVAPTQWVIVTPNGQEYIDVALDFKLPTAKIDRTLWPKFTDIRDKLFSHWQFLQPTGWTATLGAIKQLAIPAHFTTEQIRAVANYPNAPMGLPVALSKQSWWLVDPDPNMPLRSEMFSDQTELTEPLVVEYDGKNITFSLTGVIYVSN